MPDTNIGRWVFTAEALREQLFGPGGNWREVSTWTHDAQGTPALKTERLGLLYSPTAGSGFAQRHRDTLLARMIPALSLVTGQDTVEAFGSPVENFNFDMNIEGIRALGLPWPQSRNVDTRWRHSDLRVIAYPYVKGLYKRLVDLGGLR